MKDVQRQLRRNRELSVEVGKFTFTVRRPTDVEASKLHRDDASLADIARDFTIGWKGVSEDDVVGGGGTTALTFDAELWADWVADRTDFWEPIGNAVINAYTEHRKRMESVKGN